MATFLELTALLKSADTDKSKAYISKEISKALNDSESHAEMAVRNMVRNIITETSELSGFLSTDDYSFRIKAYQDDDNLTKIAIGISFIQDYRNVNEALESQILRAIIEAISTHNLDFVANDITVNSTQLRNVSADSLL